MSRSHHLSTLLFRARTAYASRSQHQATISSMTNSRRIVKGVVFDMDGTLTVPCIDFADMRQRVGITDGRDILTVINSWDEDRQRQAYKIIADFEEEALQNMQVMPGAEELCSRLDAAAVPRALLTRNVSASVEFFHATAFTLPKFHPALSREWEPFKPDPSALFHIAEHWEISPTELVMIGDSAKDDIVCGNRAGAMTILLDTEGKYGNIEELQGEMKPDYVATSLHEASVILHDHVDLVSPAKLDG